MRAALVTEPSASSGASASLERPEAWLHRKLDTRFDVFGFGTGKKSAPVSVYMCIYIYIRAYINFYYTYIYITESCPANALLKVC